MSMRFNVVVASSIAVLFLASLVLGAPYLCRAEQIKFEASDAVATAEAVTGPQWSPDGRRIFFTHNGTVYAVDAEGTQVDAIDGWLLHDPEVAAWPAVSPDGSKIAYSHYSPIGPFIWSSSSNWRIVVAELDPPRRVDTTDDYFQARNPVWLDDDRIAFAATMHLRGYYIRLPVVADVGPSGEIAGEGPIYTEGPEVEGPLVPSHDGRLIAFTSNSIRLKYRYLYVIGVDGSDLTKLDEATSLPAWHPDGSRIAYAVGGDDPDGRNVVMGIFTIRPDGTDRREIISFPEPGIKWRDGLTWHPDGSALYFAGHIVAADGSWVSDADWVGDYSTFSPDGETVARHRYGWVFTTKTHGSDSRTLVEGNPATRAKDPESRYFLAPASGRPQESE